MNKVFVFTVIACGLLLLDAPEAAAHEQRDSQYRSASHDSHDRDSYSYDRYRYGNHDVYRDRYRRDYYGSHHRRSKHMPRWLKRDRSFRRWAEHSRLRRNRYLSWNQLFDIYRREHSHYRYDRH